MGKDMFRLQNFRRYLSSSCVACLVAGILLASPSHAQLTLDDFIGDQFIITVPTLTPSVSTMETVIVPGDLNGGAGDVFGTARTVTVDTTGNGGSGTATAAILPPTGGILTFDTGATAGVNTLLTILYDSFTTTSVDVTEGGTNGAVSVEFLVVEGSADVTVTLTDGSSNSGTTTESVSSSGSLLLSLTTASLSSVDLTDIQSIELKIATTRFASDFAIDAVQFVIPEPSTALLALSGAVLVLTRRRSA
ncbi:MAG: hypothetical protein AAGH99_06765 [Planctomycetota bacterium]